MSIEPKRYTKEELRADAMQSWIEYKEGKVHPVDELISELQHDYPWLFEEATTR